MFYESGFYGELLKFKIDSMIFFVFQFEFFSVSLVFRDGNLKNTYRKVASSNTSRLEAHAGYFKLLMKGIFDPYVL